MPFTVSRFTCQVAFNLPPGVSVDDAAAYVAVAVSAHRGGGDTCNPFFHYVAADARQEVSFTGGDGPKIVAY